jgi:hypothetical protein
MDLSQFFAKLKSRNIRRLAVAYVTAGLLLIELAAILLAIFEAAAWGMKVLVRAVALGNAHAPVRRLDRSTRYKSRGRYRTIRRLVRPRKGSAPPPRIMARGSGSAWHLRLNRR